MRTTFLDMAVRWSSYTVKPGEDLAEVARRQQSTVQDIWESPRNAPLVRMRLRPELVCPGDVLQVPRLPERPVPLERTSSTAVANQRSQPAMGGADWPYETSSLKRSRPPSWSCGTGICECHPPRSVPQEKEYVVYLHDHHSVRMGGARYRVLHNGRLLRGPRYAADDGSIEFALPGTPESVTIEWAPADTPVLDHLPFQKRYILRPSNEIREGTRDRLMNIGVCWGEDLQQQVAAFQQAYRLPVDGRPESVAAVLWSYHDTGSLPPLSSPVPLPSHVRGDFQGAVSAVAEAKAPCHISYRLLRSPKQVWSNVPFELHLGGGVMLRGTILDDGILEVSPVAPGDYALWLDGHRDFVASIPVSERLRPILMLGHA